MKDFLKICDNIEYKTFLLFLTLNAYSVKYYLNESNTIKLIDS